MPPHNLFTERAPFSDARVPYIWLHPGGRLPDPYPSAPGYNRRELILDVWGRNEAEVRSALRALAFLEAWTVGQFGDAAALVYSFSVELEPSREPPSMPTSVHGHKRFAVSYLDRALVT
jgi:hypothetical protein